MISRVEALAVRLDRLLVLVQCSIAICMNSVAHGVCSNRPSLPASLSAQFVVRPDKMSRKVGRLTLLAVQVQLCNILIEGATQLVKWENMMEGDDKVRAMGLHKVLQWAMTLSLILAEQGCSVLVAKLDFVRILFRTSVFNSRIDNHTLPRLLTGSILTNANASNL